MPLCIPVVGAVLALLGSLALAGPHGLADGVIAFHKKFGTWPGNPMWRKPADRVRIW